MTIFEYDSGENVLKDIKYSLRYWKFASVPPDRPICGLQNEHCQSKSWQNVDLPAGSVTSFVLVIMIIGSLWLKHKRTSVLPDWWRITKADLTDEQLEFKTSAIVDHTSQSPRNAQDPFVREQLVKPVVIRNIPAFSTLLHVDLASERLYFSRRFEKLMTNIYMVRHQNLNRFIGLYLEIQPILAYEVYCDKGSVQDLLNVQQIDFDLKLSLIKDLCEGLSYLHRSSVRFHGHLKLTKCLVDRQLSLQISGAGHLQIASEFCDGKTKHFVSKTLYSAPETLRYSELTSAADVYGLSVISHQILTGQNVFGLENFDPPITEHAALLRLEGGEPPLLRPLFDAERMEDCPRQLLDLLEKCWAEDPNSRPTSRKARTIVTSLAQVGGGQIGQSLFDSISQRLERYSSILEEQVAEREGKLRLERARCESLLLEMLPKKVVQMLRQGVTVEAESFESVTLYFTSVTGFLEFSARVTPFEVMQYLHNIYVAFDEVLSEFKVYKVETIKDSYMVASGLPERTDSRHIAEICGLAQRLQSIFSCKLNSDQLELRAGIHTGPVVAGVVGLQRPRYCLFGDTVNTASRLESHGTSSKIHVSMDAVIAARPYGFTFQERGLLKVKGKGIIKTYWMIETMETEEGHPLVD